MWGNFDAAIFYLFNRACDNPVLDNIMLLVTEMGSGAFIAAVAVMLLFFKEKKFRMTSILLLAGLTVSYYGVQILKDFVARPRPFFTLENVNVIFVTNGFSFPSNHAAIAFLAAVILSKYFRKSPVFYGLAVIVAVSRLYLGVHFPSDVFVGACVGMIIGYVMVRIGGSLDGENWAEDKK